MPKKFTEKQKKEIIKGFTEGEPIEVLSVKFHCTKLTIIRNLKKSIGELKYKELTNKNKNELSNETSSIDNNPKTRYKNIGVKQKLIDNDKSYEEIPEGNKNDLDFIPDSSFLEIVPLDYEIENAPRKELSSQPLSDIDLPQIVYIIVEKNIELQTKFLRDYPEWGFLPIDDLNREVIEIFFVLNVAKKFCNKEQKVIKVPNTDVFRIATPQLISRGITRIVSPDKLISL